jgi:L-asparaginase II
MRALGFDGPPEWMAIGSASHSGEPRHVELVRTVLASAGLTEDALQCPPAQPMDAPPTGPPTRVQMNCSGKHAAMLVTCRRNGWPVETYLDPDHPLQVALRGALADAAGEPVPGLSVDGCGAPVFVLTLLGLARAYQHLDPAVVAGMSAHPELVGGTGRRVTELMQAVPGLAAKDGAEGVFAALLPDGRAVALKIDDGAARAADVAIGALLRSCGLDLPVDLPVLGGGRPVGTVRPVASAFD